MRRRIVVSLSFALALVVTGIGLAWATGPRIALEETIVVFSETAKFTAVDAGKRGFSVGDQDIFVDRLYSDEEKTVLVGKDRIVVEYIHSNHVMVQLEYTIDGRGKIYAAGTLNFSDQFLETGDDLTVTGGTGEFENVGGSTHLSFFDDETFLNEIHLLPLD